VPPVVPAKRRLQSLETARQLTPPGEGMVSQVDPALVETEMPPLASLARLVPLPEQVMLPVNNVPPSAVQPIKAPAAVEAVVADQVAPLSVDFLTTPPPLGEA